MRQIVARLVGQDYSGRRLPNCQPVSPRKCKTDVGIYPQSSAESYELRVYLHIFRYEKTDFFRLFLSVLFLALSLNASSTSFPELGSHPSRRHRHDDGLNRSHLLTRNSGFFGYAKVLLHSRVAGNRHGRCQVDHDGGSLVENTVVPRRIVKGLERLLLLRKHFLTPFSSGLLLLVTTNLPQSFEAATGPTCGADPLFSGPG